MRMVRLHRRKYTLKKERKKKEGRKRKRRKIGREGGKEGGRKEEGRVSGITKEIAAQQKSIKTTEKCRKQFKPCPQLREGRLKPQLQGKPDGNDNRWANLASG
jgi:hypothetical protein